MDLLTILPTLENITELERRVVNTNKKEAISYKGNINSVTINTDDNYNNVNQLCLLHDSTDLYLYINHTTRYTRAKYKLNEITSIVITWNDKPISAMAVVTESPVTTI